MKEAKRKRGRPATIQRPVLQFRVHPDVYEDLKRTAADLKITISEEAARRLDRFKEWETTFQSTKKLMADAQKTVEGDLRNALRQAGFQQVRIDQGLIWTEPGMNLSRLSLSAATADMAHEIWKHLEPKIAAAMRNEKEEPSS